MVIAEGFALPSLADLFQLGFAAVIAIVCLFHIIKQGMKQTRALEVIAITNIATQNFLLVIAMGNRHESGSEHDECRRLLAAVADLKKILEDQRVALEKAFEK